MRELPNPHRRCLSKWKINDRTYHINFAEKYSFTKPVCTHPGNILEKALCISRLKDHATWTMKLFYLLRATRLTYLCSPAMWRSSESWKWSRVWDHIMSLSTKICLWGFSKITPPVILTYSFWRVYVWLYRVISALQPPIQIKCLTFL